MFLYLTHHGSRLRREAECLVVEYHGRRLARVPAFQVTWVVVFGHCELTSGAIDLMLRKGIACTFMTVTGRLKGRLTSSMAHHVELRLAQFEKHRDVAFCLLLSREIVASKVKNQRSLLRRFDRSHRELDLKTEVKQITETLEGLQDASTLPEVRGIEGATARIYFGAFRKMLGHPVTFRRRQRRPPKDPVNVLLSLGYTLLMNEALSAVSARGFDPSVGFFHRVRPGRAALALDLMEGFRAPLVDRLVLRVVNLKMIQPSDFESTADGELRLTSKSLRVFLKEYEALAGKPFKDRRTGRLLSLRQHLLRQADDLARAVLGSGDHEYSGYLWMR